MSRYQLSFSILCIFGSAIGLFGIVRRILIGMDGLVWAALAMMFVLVWVAIKVMERKPVTDEALVRVKGAADWRELSPLRRRSMMLLDWPLFSAIRQREAKRLINEPLTRLMFEAEAVTLVPIEEQHTDAYFLKTIARISARRGLKVRNIVQGVFGPRVIGGRQIELSWIGSDIRIWNYLRSEFLDDGPASLRQFNNALEEGYISTLPDEERSKYYRDMR